MRELSEIEEILAEWNPVKVPEDLARSEYCDYAPRLARLGGDELATADELESILANTMGLSCNPRNQQLKAEIARVAILICEVSRELR